MKINPGTAMQKATMNKLRIAQPQGIFLKSRLLYP